MQKKIHRLFGYGSIVSAASASKTLGRIVDFSPEDEGELHGFRRSWTAPVEVQLDGRRPPMTACFLDLERDEEYSCNGVVIDVTESEMASFDKREIGYQRREVLVKMHNGASVEATAYVVPASKKCRSGNVVLKRYHDLVMNAVREKGPDFLANFKSTTPAPPMPLVDGAYRFIEGGAN